MSESPNSAPLAAPISAPSCPRKRRSRGASSNRPLAAISARSNASMVGARNVECAPRNSGRLTASASSPSPVSATPTRCLRATGQPNRRSAITPRKTIPVAITACTVEIGASPSAAMCSKPPALATSTPPVNQRDPSSARRLRPGRSWRIRGLERAPRDFKSQPRLVAVAATQAMTRPVATEELTACAPARSCPSL
jgi:hypothetical protein